MEANSALELYKDPFKYIIPVVGNVIEWEHYDFDYNNMTNDEIRYRFRKVLKKHPRCNVLGLKYAFTTMTYINGDYRNGVMKFEYKIPKDCKIITALYLPENFNPFLLKHSYGGNSSPSSYYYITSEISLDKMDKIDLEKVLKKCKELPENFDPDFNPTLSFRDIINKSRIPYEYNQHHYKNPCIDIHGKKYIRYEVFKPYYVNIFMSFYSVITELPMDFYIEFIYNIYNKNHIYSPGKIINFSFSNEINGVYLGDCEKLQFGEKIPYGNGYTIYYVKTIETPDMIPDTITSGLDKNIIYHDKLNKYNSLTGNIFSYKILDKNEKRLIKECKI